MKNYGRDSFSFHAQLTFNDIQLINHYKVSIFVFSEIHSSKSRLSLIVVVIGSVKLFEHFKAHE